jgi:hypothetical protein
VTGFANDAEVAKVAVNVRHPRYFTARAKWALKRISSFECESVEMTVRPEQLPLPFMPENE